MKIFIGTFFYDPQFRKYVGIGTFFFIYLVLSRASLRMQKWVHLEKD